MVRFRNATAALAMGLTVLAAASPGLAQERADEARALGISAMRAEALRACNARANRFTQHTWGHTQGDQLRACMAERGQPE
jgi:hypothetical protein